MSEPKHCEHECVCDDFHPEYDPDYQEVCNNKDCPHDTRSRPAPAPERYTGVCAVQDNCMYYSDFIESIMDELDDPDAEDPPCPIKCDKRVNPNNEHDAAIRREEREKVLKPLDTIYKKFKHLDKVLSDKMFEDSDLKSHVLHDCWQAIKESLREGAR